MAVKPIGLKLLKGVGFIRHLISFVLIYKNEKSARGTENLKSAQIHIV